MTVHHTMDAACERSETECERLFGRERGAEMRAMIETALGRPCPCTTGEPCPLKRSR